jgi:hypothetical protein
MSFTGIKDLDIKILSELSDKDLYNVCRVNTLLSKICNDNNFWRIRLNIRFPDSDLTYKKSGWKSLYIYHRIKEKYGEYLGDVSNIVGNKPISVLPEEYYKWLNKFFDLIKLLYDYPDYNLDMFTDLEYKLNSYPSLKLGLTEYIRKRFYHRDKISSIYNTELPNINLDELISDAKEEIRVKEIAKAKTNEVMSLIDNIYNQIDDAKYHFIRNLRIRLENYLYW